MAFAFLRQPRWIVGHGLVIVIAIAFVALGLWQLRRHDERIAFNQRIEANRDISAVAFEDVDFDAPGSLEWRLVEMSGTYDLESQFVVRSRSLEGVAGVHIVTPLQLDDSSAVLVKRGWIPLGAGPEDYAPAPGVVSVTGRLRPSVEPPRIGPKDAPEGALGAVYWLNVDRIQQQVATPLAPMWVELVEASPAGSNPPVPVPIPEVDAGPHLAYAVQWFAFAAIGVVGYGFLIRRGRRKPAQA